MASAGPNSPSTLASGGGPGVAWSNPSNAGSSNNVYATATLSSSSEATRRLQATNFGFAIDAGATITGIVVEVEGQSTEDNLDANYQLRKNSGAVGAVKRGTIGITEMYRSAGSSSDLWNTTWAPADINHANFGVDFRANNGGSLNTGQVISVDHIRITVYYTLPPTVTVVSPTSGAATGGTAVSLTGTGFVVGGTTVKFGSTLATSVVVQSSTTLTCVAPAGTAGTTVFVTVTTSAGTSANNASAVFTYLSALSIASVTPSSGTRLGGTSVTIAGTGFSGSPTVTFGGNAASSVVVNSSVEMTCVTPAGTTGAVSVTVTLGASTATLTNGYTYTPVTHSKALTGAWAAPGGALSSAFAKDNIVKLVKAGAVVGDNKANSVAWTGTDTYIAYGGASDLWGTTWTPSQVNASDFGLVLSVDTDAGVAKVDHARVTVFFEVQGVRDPTSMLATLKIDETRQVATPQIYKLGRSGMPIANDPNVPKSRDDAELYTGRFFQPTRSVEKVWRNAEFWLDIDPEESNTAGFELWAGVDDGSFYHLLDEDGAVATFRTTGPCQAFFPKTSAAVGHYVQLLLKVPAKSGVQQNCAVTIRDLVLHGSMRPLVADHIQTTLILGGGEFEDLTSQRRSIKQQKEDLRAIAGRHAAPVPFRTPNGETGYLEVKSVQFRELVFRGQEVASTVAIMDMRVVRYDFS